MKGIRLSMLKMQKLFPKKGTLHSCKTNLSRQKFAESQITLANTLMAGGMLSALAQVAAIADHRRIDFHFLGWMAFTTSFFVFAQALRQRGLRLIDQIELKTLRTKRTSSC